MQDARHKNKSRLGLWIVIGLAVAGGAAALLFKSQPATTKKITIAQAGDFFLYAPLYVAVDAGLLARHAVDASIISTGGDEKTWAAVVGGSAQFGVADPTFVAIADARGLPGRVIANLVDGVPFWGITLSNSVPEIASPKSLAGYSVATFPAPSTAYALQKRMFESAGLPVTIRQGAFGTLIAMLHSGAADIALELEPNVSQAAAEGARVVYGMPEVYGSFAITGLTTTPDLLEKDPDLARAVVCGLQEALDYIRQRPADTLAILAKRFPEIGQSVAKDALARVVAANIVPTSPVTSAEGWDKALQLRVEVGDLQRAKPMDAYVDNGPASHAASACRLQ